jgi:hypothetical protein
MLTKLVGSPEALLATVRSFMPKGCTNTRGWPPYSWWAFTWVDRLPEQEVDGGQTIYYISFRWYGYGLVAEREKALSKDPEAKEAWARAIDKCSHPTRVWEQERWDIETGWSSLPPNLIEDTTSLAIEP